MATFTESEITDLAATQGVASYVIVDHVTLAGNYITDSDKTQLLDWVADWQAVEKQYAAFTPTESNEGLNLNLAQQKAAIAAKIAGLLDFQNQTNNGRLIRC